MGIHSRSNIKIGVLGNLRAPYTDLVTMGWIRWFRIGEAFAKLGYQVDLITDDIYFRGCEHIEWYKANFRKRSAYAIQWSDYHVIKILMHSGFQSFKNAGGLSHPFIITGLGSAVAAEPREGIYFFGEVHKRLLNIQNEIVKHSRYITTLTDANEQCMRELYPDFKNYLRVPTGVDREIPSPGSNPYEADGYKVCIYAGHIYDATSQPELNQAWQDKLNDIGTRLFKKRIKLYFLGTGDISRLDPQAVLCMPAVPNAQFWDYQYYADVGLALSDGPRCDNESSKIYYYLRGGLPVVAEDSLPNATLIDETRYGEKVPYNDIECLCNAIDRCARKGKSDQQRVMEYMAQNHSWNKRVEIYDRVIQEKFNLP